MRVRLGTLRKLIREEIDMSDVSGDQMSGDGGRRAGTAMKMAKDTGTRASTLAALSKDPDWEVRSAVARNPSTPKETLVAMSGDENMAVRMMVARNPKTPQDVVATINRDIREPNSDGLDIAGAFDDWAREEEKQDEDFWDALRHTPEFQGAIDRGTALGKLRKGRKLTDSDYPDDDPFKSGWGDY